MPSFGKVSLKRLENAHPVIQKVFEIAIRRFDITIIQTYRTKAEHEEYVLKGTTSVSYEKSKHSKNPSEAIDAAPYPINWDLKDLDNLERWYYFGGYIIGISEALYAAGIIDYKIRWGGDWNKNNKFGDQKLNDLPHFEMYKPE